VMLNFIGTAVVSLNRIKVEAHDALTF